MANTGKRSRAASRKKSAKDKTRQDNPPITDTEDLEDIEENEPTEQQQKKSFQLLDSDDLDETSDSELRDFLERNELLEAGYTATLYKYVNPVHGEKREICGQWYEQILTENEVGLKYGSGRYMVIVRAVLPDGSPKIKKVYFRINKSYDTMREETELINSNPLLAIQKMQGSPGGDGAGNNFMMSILLMREMIKTFMPIIQAKNTQSPGAGLNELLLTNYKNTSELLKESMLDNMQLINDIQRSAGNLESVYEDESEVSPIQGFIKTFAPLIEKFIPMIVGGGQGAKQTISAVKQFPQYAQIVKSKKNLKSVVKYLDSKHGNLVTDKLLKKLGVERP